MHPVLGTMMPEICEAPHLPVFPFIHHRAPDLMGWDVFITFLQAGRNNVQFCLDKAPETWLKVSDCPECKT